MRSRTPRLTSWMLSLNPLLVMTRLLLYANTLRYLRASQLFALIRKRLIPSTRRVPQVTEVRLRPGVGVALAPHPTHQSDKPYTFQFLNRERCFPDGRIDWRCADLPKLWRYNLHYFDYLKEEGRPLTEQSAVISHWIAHNPPGAQDAWEPYTLSLRVVNWITFFLRTRDPLPAEWLYSLYAQVLWLEDDLEDHLLANHYLKNGVALFVAGLYFEGGDAERWLALGRRILSAELEEQFLADGGHYERSPMYHAISLLDYLDVLNFMQNSRAGLSFQEEPHIVSRMRDALAFLDDICLPDGDIPLFNDAAIGIAPPPADILAYGQRLTGYARKSIDAGVKTIQKPQTGYYVIREGSDMMIIDCGPVGPDYQPGHAHADTLSFELAVDGRRVIVDSGVYDYEPGPRRQYARSTNAHNTLSIDGLDQSETWGVFRVARRAYPLYARLTQPGAQPVKFEGAHDGYRRLNGHLTHSRTVDYDTHGRWQVQDTVEGTGEHTIESRLHVHPDLLVELTRETIQIRDERGQMILTISPTANVETRIEQGWAYSEFGRERANSTILMTYRGAVPVSLGYRMHSTTPVHE